MKALGMTGSLRVGSCYGRSSPNGQSFFLIVLQYHLRVAVYFAFVAAAEDVAEDMGMAFEVTLPVTVPRESRSSVV